MRGLYWRVCRGSKKKKGLQKYRLFRIWINGIFSYYFLGFSKDTGVGFGASCEGPGDDKSKYSFESSVTPKSLFEPLFCTLFKASLNNALCASSLFSRKSIVALTSLSSIWRYRYS